MGLYDDVLVAAGVRLPKFPADASPSDIGWQTKEIGRPASWFHPDGWGQTDAVFQISAWQNVYVCRS